MTRQYLNGWSVNSNTNVVNQNTLAPIQVTKTGYNPVATSAVTLGEPTGHASRQHRHSGFAPLFGYHCLSFAGMSHVVTPNWAQAQDGNGNVVPNSWTVKITAVDGQADIRRHLRPGPHRPRNRGRDIRFQ